MRDPLHAADLDAPVSADVNQAQIEFHHTDADSAVLALEYRVPGKAVSVEATDIQRGVAAVCEVEVASMRVALRAAGGTLAAQLNDDGKEPVVTLKTIDDDHRQWLDAGAEFLVRPSSYQSETVLQGIEGVSDARLVQQTIELTIAHRERSIRKLYAKILADASAKPPVGNGLKIGEVTSEVEKVRGLA